jgi:hypothetical protein
MMEKAGSMIWNSVRMPGYFSNYLTLVKPKKLDDGSYVFAIPMEGKPLYLMDVEDLGECVAGKIMVVVVMMVVLVIDNDSDGGSDGGSDGNSGGCDMAVFRLMLLMIVRGVNDGSNSVATMIMVMMVIMHGVYESGVDGDRNGKNDDAGAR